MSALQRGFNTTTSWIADLGRGALFLLRILMSLPSLLLKPRLLVEQIYSVGVLSLVIVVVAGIFVGMVLAAPACCPLPFSIERLTTFFRSND